MLTLSNSFCRYLWLACESSSYKIHVRHLTHLSKIYTESYKGQVQRPRKKSRVKIPAFNANDPIKPRQMSETEPTSNHASYGGLFEVSSGEECSPEGRLFRDSGSDGREKRKAHGIPSDFRIWEAVGKRSDKHDDTFRFKVMSYNVLAQCLLQWHPYLYRHCSPRNLKWNVRAARLYDEIINLAPDILCLQEVEASHLNSFYAKFEQIGYFGIFKQKTGHRHDGCAIYFKQSMFEMKDHISVEFYQPDLPILNRDNIGIMVKLVPHMMPSSPIVIATTHLLYNPKRTDVRLAQLQVLLAEIDRFAYCSTERESGHLPIILTGDFNSTPESAVVQLLDRGHVRAGAFRDNSDWTRIGVTDNCQHLAVYLSRQEGLNTDFSNLKIFNSDYRSRVQNAYRDPDDRVEQFREMFNSGDVGHSLRLTSVYDKYKKDNQYEASTFQDYWVTVDYIYFSCSGNLKLIDRLRLPTVTECGALGRLPNEVYASDHLALAATFELAPMPCKSAL